MASFNQTWHNSSLAKRIERSNLSPMGENSKIVKGQWEFLKALLCDEFIARNCSSCEWGRPRASCLKVTSPPRAMGRQIVFLSTVHYLQILPYLLTQKMKQRVDVRSVSDWVQGQICYPFPPTLLHTLSVWCFDIIYYNIQNTSHKTYKKEEKQD